MKVLPPLGNKTREQMLEYVAKHKVPLETCTSKMTAPQLKDAAFGHDQQLFNELRKRQAEYYRCESCDTVRPHTNKKGGRHHQCLVCQDGWAPVS